MRNRTIKKKMVGGEVDCTTKTSSPRTFSSILTKVSPSGNALTVHLPRSLPMDLQIALANGGLDVPLKIFTTTQKRKNHPKVVPANRAETVTMNLGRARQIDERSTLWRSRYFQSNADRAMVGC